MKKRKYLNCELILFNKKELQIAIEETKELNILDIIKYLKSNLDGKSYEDSIVTYFEYLEEFEWSASMIKREWVPIVLEDLKEKLNLVISNENQIGTIESRGIKKSYINSIANGSYPHLWFLFYGHNIPYWLSREYVFFLESNSLYIRGNSIFSYDDENYEEFYLYQELYGLPANETGRELRELTSDMAIKILEDFKQLPIIPDNLKSEHVFMEEKLMEVVKEEIYFLLEYSD